MQFFLTGDVATNAPVIDTIGQNITMTCDFSGYLPVSYNITWIDPQGDALTNNSRHTISTGSGVGQSQSGGSSPGPSVLSTLSISTVDEMDFGTYVCSMMGMNGAQLAGSVELNLLMEMMTGNYQHSC